MLLCCRIPFHFYTVHAGNFSSSTLQLFEIVDFVIIVVVVFNNGFLEYSRLQITRTFKGNREFELSGARRK